MVGPGRTVTVLLREWRAGDHEALDQLMPLVYAELHKLAASYMRSDRPGHTFRPTDLVAEAYLRLVDGAQPEFNDRVHFFGIAARTMRQVLVDHARRRNAAKRGAGHAPVPLEEDTVAAGGRPAELIALDEALVALACQDERKARVVELHYFGGLTQEEIGEVLGVHVNTVARDLRFAEAWIQRQLQAQ